MATNSIPRIVAQWIRLQIPLERRPHDGFVDQLTEYGLATLNVSELKIIEKRLYAKHAVVEEPSITSRSLSSSAKKHIRVDFIRRALYRDNDCSILNQRLLTELQNEMRTPCAASSLSKPAASAVAMSSPSTQRKSTAATTATTLTTSSTPMLNASSTSKKRSRDSAHARSTHPTTASAAPQWTNAQTTVTPSALAFERPMTDIQTPTWHPGSEITQRRPFPNFHNVMMDGIRAHMFTPFLGPQHQLFRSPQYQQASYNPAATLASTTACHPQPFPTHGLHFHLPPSFHRPAAFPPDESISADDPNKSAATSTTSTSLNNNNNNNNSDSNLPQSPTETHIMYQLTQMGFTNREEMINGIRQSGRTTADEVMMFIVSQREEADEARKEDEVRLISEEQKQEEEKRKKVQREHELADAHTGQDLRKIFKTSWILEGLLSNGNDYVIIDSIVMKKRRAEFLDFLGLEEKSRKWYCKLPSYYFRNMCSRLKTDHGGTMDWLPMECEKLRSGLTQLKEQKGGRPKLFVDSREQETGCKDAEVIVID